MNGQVFISELRMTAFMSKSMVLVVLFFLLRTSSSSNVSDKRRENSTHSVFST